jgi:hypothetical protein
MRSALALTGRALILMLLWETCDSHAVFPDKPSPFETPKAPASLDRLVQKTAVSILPYHPPSDLCRQLLIGLPTCPTQSTVKWTPEGSSAGVEPVLAIRLISSKWVLTRAPPT